MSRPVASRAELGSDKPWFRDTQHMESFSGTPWEGSDLDGSQRLDATGLVQSGAFLIVDSMACSSELRRLPECRPLAVFARVCTDARAFAYYCVLGLKHCPTVRAGTHSSSLVLPVDCSGWSPSRPQDKDRDYQDGGGRGGGVPQRRVQGAHHCADGHAATHQEADGLRREAQQGA